MLLLIKLLFVYIYFTQKKLIGKLIGFFFELIRVNVSILNHQIEVSKRILKDYPKSLK